MNFLNGIQSVDSSSSRGVSFYTFPSVTLISSHIWLVFVLLQVIHLATSRVSELFMTNLEALQQVNIPTI